MFVMLFFYASVMPEANCLFFILIAIDAKAEQFYVITALPPVPCQYP
jgi:hypothetical protein